MYKQTQLSRSIGITIKALRVYKMYIMYLKCYCIYRSRFMRENKFQYLTAGEWMPMERYSVANDPYIVTSVDNFT